MRSPQGKLPTIHFCPNCDNDPDSSSSSNHSAGASTPPTEASNPPDSPQFIPVTDTEGLISRREQSDRASREIGTRLLQGWAMLADECPGPTCYGVPLVRPPKVGNDKNPRKECVICGVSYISEVDLNGRQRLTPLNAVNQNSDSTRAETTHGSSSQVVPTVADVIAHDAAAQFTTSSFPQLMDGSYGRMEILQVLDKSSKSLQSALRTLSSQLETLSRQDIPANSPSIGSTADAILKVTEALSQVRQLEQSERQGRSLLGSRI
ncbi:hypothetical protein AX14_005716 [Amanita brunnescens Koide BX004]|nr:hypothetical protein AX14_005716 [Amanita brunnescens Koide BX004]